MPTYTDEASGIQIESQEDLTDAEIEEALMSAGAPALGEMGDLSQTQTPTTNQTAPTQTRTSTGPQEGTTTPRSPSPQIPADESTILPFLDRIVPTVVGAGAGGLATGGNPLGIVLGGAIGATGGDILGQSQEIVEGTRAQFNPLRNLAEAVLGGAAANVGVGANNLISAAGKVAGFNALSDTAIELSEGRPIPSKGQFAISALSGALLGGVSHYVSKRAEIKELLGDDEATDVADAILSGKKVRVSGADHESIEELRKSVLKARVPAKSTKRTLDKAKEVLESLEEFEKPRQINNPSKLAGLAKWEPNKFQLERLQRESGVPVFEDYLKLRPLYERYKRELGGDAKELRSIFRLTSKETRVAMLRALATGEEGNLPAGKMRRLHGLFDKALDKFGVSQDEFFEAAFGTGVGTPRKLKGLAEYITLGDVTLKEPDALVAAGKLLRAARFKEFVEPQWKELSRTYGQKGMPRDIKEPMMKYLNAVRGRPDKQTAFLTEVMNEVLSKLDPAMAKFGKRPIRVDARDIVSTIMAANYSGLLGYRLGPVVRNMFQTVQTAGPLMGGRWLAEGYRQLGTQGGRARAAAAGMRSQALELAEVEEMARSALGRGVSAVARWGLKPFGMVEDVNRSAVYLGTYAKVLNAAKKAKGNLARFINKSDVDRMTPGERDHIAALYQTGKLEDAADMAAKFMVDNTQFMYGGPERPQLVQSLAGRVLGGFGVWPMSYASYMKRMASNGPGWKRGRDFARFVVANAAIGGGFAGAGSMFGDEDSIHDALSWTFFEPLFYTGGPALELIISAGKAGRELASGKIGHGVQEFRKNAAGFIPGSMAAKEAWKARDEDTMMESVGRLLGLKRGAQ